MKEINDHRIESIPSLKVFSDEINQTKKEDFFCLQSSLEKLAKKGFLHDLLDYELNHMADNSKYAPMRGTYNYISIIDRENVYFSLFYKKMNLTNVHKYYSGYPSDQIICSLSSKGFNYSFFEQPAVKTFETIDYSVKLTPLETDKKLLLGESICIDKDKHLLSFTERDNIVIALVLGAKEFKKHVLEYESKNLSPVRLVSGTPQQSRVEFTANILGQIGNEKSIPVLYNLLSYDAHNVRWEAARSLVKLNMDKGIEALELLKDDTNEDVRKLAEMSLQQINSLKNQNHGLII